VPCRFDRDRRDPRRARAPGRQSAAHAARPLDLPTPAAIYLKLENLQPIGSFKLRGALNAILQTDPDDCAAGVVTASAGNMGQGVAWAARELGLPCTVVVPDHAPETKLAAIERLGGRS
jgi:threonine dehydratase